MQDYTNEQVSVFDLFIYPIHYFRILKAKKIVLQKIKNIDIGFSLPKLKIRYTFVTGKAGGLCEDNGKWTLKINPTNTSKFDYLLRIVTHEFVHYWLGPDFRYGWKIFPQDIPKINEIIGLYKNPSIPLRLRLFCFIYQQSKFNKKFNNLMKLNGYDDIYFKNCHNPYVNFEEQLVTYTTMKLWGDDISTYPELKKAFEQNFYDKEILLYMDDKMPHLPEAVEKLLTGF